jgi:hypothetical protein
MPGRCTALLRVFISLREDLSGSSCRLGRLSAIAGISAGGQRDAAAGINHLCAPSTPPPFADESQGMKLLRVRTGFQFDQQLAIPLTAAA